MAQKNIGELLGMTRSARHAIRKSLTLLYGDNFTHAQVASCAHALSTCCVMANAHLQCLKRKKNKLRARNKMQYKATHRFRIIQPSRISPTNRIPRGDANHAHICEK